VSVLDHNEPDFYCIPVASWEAIVDRLEDVELNAIADAREGQEAIEANISDL
jgi:antitoxin StbD